MSTQPPDERKTDVSSLRPEATDTSRESVVVPRAGNVPSAETWPGYDENSFLHRATAAVIDGTNALLKARQTYDIEAIVQRQRVLFEESIGQTVVPKLEQIADRVTKTEDDMRSLRSEFAQMKTRMTQIEAQLGIKTSS